MTDDGLFNLADKVAVVTGGGAGIGAAICQRLAAHGATVAIAEIDPARGEATRRLRAGAAGPWPRA